VAEADAVPAGPAGLRTGDTYTRLAAGFAISTTTAWRYVRESVDLPATLADDVHAAAVRATRLAYTVLDGTLIPMDRLADERPYYSGKHKQHGMNVQLLADPAGRLVWASPALPAAVHDVSAAWAGGLIDALTVADVKTLADKSYQGAGGTVLTPFKRRRHRPWLSRGQRDVNRAHSRIRAIGERAVATLKSWKVLTKLRCCPPSDRAHPGHHRPAAHRRAPLLRMKGLAALCPPAKAPRALHHATPHLVPRHRHTKWTRWAR
jgi:hypothetical protein